LYKLALNQGGYMKRGALLLIAVLVLAGGVGWYVWDQNKNDTKAQNSTQTTAPAASSQTNNSYLVIKEWGVRFKLPEDLKGKVNYFHRNGAPESYAINDPDVELDNCAPISLDRTNQSNAGYRKVGQYYYVAIAGAQACDTSESTRQQNANKVQDELKAAITNSLEQAQ
jgi:hypothetical protein